MFDVLHFVGGIPYNDMDGDLTGGLYIDNFYGCLHTVTIHYEDQKVPINFRKLLVTRCQKEFEQVRLIVGLPPYGRV